MKNICITVDMEPDCPPYLNTFRGIEEGATSLIGLLDTEQIKATFFTTGRVARKYPKVVEIIVSHGHELGCHGDSHRIFTEMDEIEARLEIQQSSYTLRQFAPVTAFRAPNLKFPDKYLKILETAGYLIDSSQARYKPDCYRKTGATSLKRIPVSTTSSVLRLPRRLLFPILNFLTEPVVLFVHPWEFVDLSHENLRLDCRFKTGTVALECLRAILGFFKNKNACFLKMTDLCNR